MTVSGPATGVRQMLLAVAVSLLAVSPRLFLLRLPFERDEGAYAYLADCISRGELPYLAAFDHKPPAIYYLYRLAFDLFGHLVSAPRLLATIFVAVACLLTILLVRHFTRDLMAGLFAGLLLGIATSSSAYHGFVANTELFSLPFIVGGVLFLVADKLTLRRFFLSGLLFGGGIAVKQPVASFAVAAFVWQGIALARTPRRLLVSGVLFGCGCLLPLGLFAGYFAAQGAFAEFWAASFSYNFGYVTGLAPLERLRLLQHSLAQILSNDPVTWVAGCAGGLTITLTAFHRGYSWLLALVLAGAGAATAMGQYFYVHYFLFMLLPLTLAAGVGLGQLADYSRRKWLRAAAVVVLGASLLTQFRQLTMDGKSLVEANYGTIPFVQTRVIGDYLRTAAPPGASLFIFGSEPQIAFYSGLVVPSRYFYLYPLMTPTVQREQMRQELMADLSRNVPDYFVFVHHPTSHTVVSFARNTDPLVQALCRGFASFRLEAYCLGGTEELVTAVGGSVPVIRQTGLGTVYLFRRAGAEIGASRPTFADVLDMKGV